MWWGHIPVLCCAVLYCPVLYFTVPTGHEDYVGVVSEWTGPLPLVISGSSDGTLKVWDTRDGSLVATLDSHVRDAWAVEATMNSVILPKQQNHQANDSSNSSSNSSSSAGNPSQQYSSSSGSESTVTNNSTSSTSCTRTTSAATTLSRSYDTGSSSSSRDSFPYKYKCNTDIGGIRGIRPVIVSGSYDRSVKVWDIQPVLADLSWARRRHYCCFLHTHGYTTNATTATTPATTTATTTTATTTTANASTGLKGNHSNNTSSHNNNMQNKCADDGKRAKFERDTAEEDEEEEVAVSAVVSLSSQLSTAALVNETATNESTAPLSATIAALSAGEDADDSIYLDRPMHRVFGSPVLQRIVASFL
mmetsp:Transcript_25611/g.42937  ORF Transcript_25611/g.42937 Transcript_25611/m.42937 type:complete len:362 (+) Transcript_25611:400-1485(+)